MDTEVVLVERKIHYHELHIAFNKSYHVTRKDQDAFLDFFSKIALMARDKEKIRYQQIGDAKIFVQDVVFEDQEKKVLGKLRSVRNDVFPEIMNTVTDEAKGIEAEEYEGIVETTHFIIDYSKPTKKIAIEHNQPGAKIVEFVKYCEIIGSIKGMSELVQFIPIAKNELVNFKERINFLSQLIVRVHKENIEYIESIDSGLYSALENTIDQFDAEYAELKLKFKYGKVQGEQKVQKLIANVITKLIADKKRLNLFDVLKIKAQDEENNNRLHLFNLLIDKIESTIKVQRKPKYKTVISVDIFEKMKGEMRKRRL